MPRSRTALILVRKKRRARDLTGAGRGGITSKRFEPISQAVTLNIARTGKFPSALETEAMEIERFFADPSIRGASILSSRTDRGQKAARTQIRLLPPFALLSAMPCSNR